MTQDWPAPTASGPLRATVAVPGSKSITNRALVLAALSDGPSRITGGLVARDSELMIAGLQALGVSIEGSAGDWQVQPAPLRGPATIDCGLAGTVMRFLPPIACLATGAIRLDGDPRARERPMGQLVESLAGLGAEIRATDGALPVVVDGRGALPGGQVTLDASASSQFVSGLQLRGQLAGRLAQAPCPDGKRPRLFGVEPRQRGARGIELDRIQQRRQVGLVQGRHPLGFPWI